MLHNLPNGTYYHGVTTLRKTSENENKPENYLVKIFHGGNQGTDIEDVNKNLSAITSFLPEVITIKWLKEKSKYYTEYGSPSYWYEFSAIFGE